MPPRCNSRVARPATGNQAVDGDHSGVLAHLADPAGVDGGGEYGQGGRAACHPAVTAAVADQPDSINDFASGPDTEKKNAEPSANNRPNWNWVGFRTARVKAHPVS